jgi:zinc-binding in reverse transcriptase
LEWIDSDIIESIQQKILPNGEFKHLKGHQKIDNKNEQKLEVVLNNWVDDMANKAITSDKTMTSPENIAHVVVNGKRLFKQLQMITQCAEHILQQYHKSKYGSVNYHHIDWELYKKIISKFSKSMSILKMIHSLTPTNSQLHQQNNNISSQCPLCKREEETIHHILKCDAKPNNFCAANESRKVKKDMPTSQYAHIMKMLEKILDPQPPNEQNLPAQQIQIGWHWIRQCKITKTCIEWMKHQLRESIPHIKLENFMITLLQDWSDAWKFRNQQVTHDNYAQISRAQINKKKLEYLYSN